MSNNYGEGRAKISVIALVFSNLQKLRRSITRLTGTAGNSLESRFPLSEPRSLRPSSSTVHSFYPIVFENSNAVVSHSPRTHSGFIWYLFNPCKRLPSSFCSFSTPGIFRRKGNICPAMDPGTENLADDLSKVKLTHILNSTGSWQRASSPSVLSSCKRSIEPAGCPIIRFWLPPYCIYA